MEDNLSDDLSDDVVLEVTWLPNDIEQGKSMRKSTRKSMRQSFLSDATSTKVRILALHGKQSNNAVTQRQLENLHITEDKYEIVYLAGPLVEEHGDPSIEEFFNGPFYSWYHSNTTDARFKPSLFRAVIHVLRAIETLGPFNAIYGFSQGATMATLVASAYEDNEIKDAIIEAIATDEASGQRFANLKTSIHVPRFSSRSSNKKGSMMSFKASMRGSTARNSMMTARKSMMTARNSMMTARKSMMASMTKSPAIGVTRSTFEQSPFEYMILACAADFSATFKQAVGLSNKCLVPSCVGIPSFHLIGIEDPSRPNSEKIAGMFSVAQIKYIVGGHAISRLIEQDDDLLRSLHGSLKERGNVVQMNPPVMTQVSDVSSIGVMSPLQVTAVDLHGLIDNPSIVKLLEAKDPHKELFYNARDKDPSNFISYGEVLKFIQGGPGDLRRLGINPGEVVAYAAPPSGGAVSALALLSIMSQTTAAPLAQNTSEADALDLLEQFSAKHLILFDGVECPGVEAAFASLSASGKAKLHRATIRADDKPGMFDYTVSGDQALDPTWVPSSEILQNPSDGVGLLLGTSGTTSRPKGVPLLHGSIVQNGHILASSLGLRETDVCYSIMPLFHIGGISASILCTLASGGSVCCDGQGYNPENMVNALAVSNPQPTWYSSVPTIHNATVSFIKDMASSDETLRSYGIDENGIWKKGHSLRMIRSGAAVLLGSDALALTSTYGGIPVIPTYSMSEQMPISQPPYGKTDMVMDKPGSVGVPVSGSMAIVNISNLRVTSHGEEGEIAICGPTVMGHYLNNKEADKKAFFELTLPIDPISPFARGRYFLTGDLGVMDKDGFLTIKGRNKEMIKKGGEQVSPVEIEEPLRDLPWVEVVLCFAVPSKLFGEEVGCAIVLSSSAPAEVDINKITKDARELLRVKKISPLKWPTKWIVVEDEVLPKTKSKKYIRVGLAKVLGVLGDVEEENNDVSCPLVAPVKMKRNTFIDWNVISGFRFFLACYVMFMHIGSNNSWSAFSNLRGWPWHVHTFFTLGGFSLAAPMNPVIQKKFKYALARIGAMYPMYFVALLFGVINLLVTCRPSTFRPEFHWDAQPDDLYIDGDESKGLAPLFCEGTPATPNSYWGSLILTIVVYVLGSAITPLWALSWWMGYYLWFSAMYYQCLLIFPVLYNNLLKWRGKTRRFMQLLVGLLVANFVLLIVTWFLVKDANGYNHYDDTTGEKNSVYEPTKGASTDNRTILGWYLFSPFWMLHFAVGACTAFLYDAYRPAEKTNVRIWGYVADGCTLAMLIWSICIITQGFIDHGIEQEYALRPEEANLFTDTAAVNRIWDNICGRLTAPLITLWIFSLSTGEGWTAALLRWDFLAETLAPHSYNCFLFHQMVAQWYYAATRNGHWWNWWRYRKTMYWFSPSPCPVEWYEYIYVVGLTVAFSCLANATMEPLMSAIMSFFKDLMFGASESEGDDINLEEALISAIEDMTGLAPELDWSLDQCGLSSVGLPQLASRLKKMLSSKTEPVAISVVALAAARTVGDIVQVLEDARSLAEAAGV